MSSSRCSVSVRCLRTASSGSLVVLKQPAGASLVTTSASSQNFLASSRSRSADLRSPRVSNTTSKLIRTGQDSRGSTRLSDSLNSVSASASLPSSTYRSPSVK
ncbi:Uncharacterised protein [Mycobacteroides abscessus subsp. abscessus]|nr:Uncharacterised protein [Mycobacteroides abscessus subsp. abscessus]